MSKIQLKLIETEEDKDEEITEEVTNEEVTEDAEEPVDFINSDELNEIRDILLDIPEDITLLLLNDDTIVLGNVVDQTTFLYTLPDDSEDFVLIEMPMQFTNIVNDDSIVKYTSEKIDDRHSKVVDILMKKLTPTESKEEVEDVKED